MSAFLLSLLLVTGAEASKPSWPTLEGRWAFVHVTAAVSDAPLIGEVTSETRALGLLDLHQEGPVLALSEHVCDLRTRSPTPFVSTHYPKAFLTALSGNRREARLEAAPEGGYRFVQPKAWDVKGVQLDDPEQDPLPEDGEDPRLEDPDADGHPGLTVRIKGIASGDIRVVSKGWTALEGRVESTERIEGRVAWRTEQRIVSTTNGLLSHQPKPEPHPDPERSWFRMVRVGSDTSCAGALAHTEVLLEPVD